MEGSDQRARLESLEIEVILQEERVAEARTERGLVEERLVELAVSIEALERRLGVTRDRLRRGLVTLYRLGGDGLWRWLLTARADSEALAGRRTLRYLSWQQSTRVAAFRRDRAELDRQRSEAVVERRRSIELLSSETKRLARLDELRRERAAVVVALEREEAELARRAAELEERHRKLADLIEFLGRQAPQEVGDVPIQRFKGVLDWPLEGEIVEGFGLRTDPRYGTTVPHNGLSFAPRAGHEVRGVFPGSVVFAQDFEDFGITIVIHHTGRVFTLYAGLASAWVATGDVVSSGQILGRASGRLYFEVRVEKRPEDPLEWLR